MLPVWIDGALVPGEEATVPVSDHGLTVGDGVFETMRTAPDPDDGTWRPFAVTRHLRRLRRSLEAVDLALDRHDDELRGAIEAVAATVGGPARVRITVTGGPGPAGTGRADAGAPGAGATCFVVAAPFDGWPPTGSAVTVPWRRNEHGALVGVKSTSYAENVIALRHARAAGADEALLANTAGALCEGTGTNAFVVVDGRIATPPLASGCLAGVTRELVCELVDVDEVDVPIEVLGSADEVFLTSTTRDVQGLHSVDGRTLPAPGPVTAATAAAFAALVARDIDP